jgi:molybdopterin/thiamine biosynthesis adenylyltransferase
MSQQKSTFFDYKSAFDRNIGWVTDCELQQLRAKKVAIAGMGGVGGFHLLTLTRLGITHFNIADFDQFEIQNFNRQIGATLSSIHHPKADVLEKMAKEINPELQIQVFRQGVSDENLDEFLKDVDLYVDGLDFFALNIREKVFKRCRELNIPAITAGPIGMGSAYFIFMPDTMSFEEYFQFAGLSDEDRRINFLIGLTPKFIPFKYQVDPTTTNLEEKRGPSTIMACELCAGIMGVEALKILLKRGHIYPAPYFHFFDAYLGKYYRKKIPWGNRNPIQKLKRIIVKRKLAEAKFTKPSPYSVSDSQSDIEKILDLSRWAPSIDNNQPWRFEIKSDTNVLIHIKDHSDTDFFDFAGIPTLLAAGMLLETIRIAASHFSRTCESTYQKISAHKHLLDVKLNVVEKISSDDLFHFIPYRTVDRERYRTTSLTEQEKNQLNKAIGNEFELRWYETEKERWEMSKINGWGTSLFLRDPKIFQSRLEVVDTQHIFSENAIPMNSIGLSYVTKQFMLWAMKKESRAQFLVNWLGASYLKGLELDVIPGMLCAAHFILVPKHDSTTYLHAEKLLHAGSALQKFWLTATKLGLVMQPNFASLALAYYSNHSIHFTDNKSVVLRAKKFADKINHFCKAKNILFKGRVGAPVSSKLSSRSARKPLKELLIKSDKSKTE